MTNKQLKNLKDTLWTTADQLRANSGLKSTEYAEPIYRCKVYLQNGNGGAWAEPDCNAADKG